MKIKEEWNGYNSRISECFFLGYHYQDGAASLCDDPLRLGGDEVTAEISASP
jgi:hypothetical protein